MRFWASFRPRQYLDTTEKEVVYPMAVVDRFWAKVDKVGIAC